MAAYHSPDTPQRKLIESLEVRVFVRLDVLRSLSLTTTTLLYKTRQPITGLMIDQVDTVDLPFGKAMLLTCKGIAIGYEFYMPPRCRVDVRPNYATFKLRDTVKDDAERYLVNHDIAVIGNDHAIAILSPRIFWTATDDMNNDRL